MGQRSASLDGATPAQEAAYLQQWRRRRLAEERRHGEYLEMLERDAKAEQREIEEEAAQAAAQPAAELPATDIAAARNTVFRWAGPAPTLIDLTDPEDDNDDNA